MQPYQRWNLLFLPLNILFFMGMIACRSKAQGSGADSATGHHELPGITNFSVDYDRPGKKIRVFYDIRESEQRQVAVHIYYMSGKDNYLRSFDDPVMGDAGDSVVPGNHKKIVIHLGSEPGADSIKVALVVDDEIAFPVSDYIRQVDTVALRRNLEGIAGLRNQISDPAHLTMVKKQLKDSLLKYGYDVRLQSFIYKGYEAQNIVARKPGFGKKRRKIILCAHYDTVIDSPGADDNGSGIAVLLEIARMVAKLPAEDALEIVFFDLEEPGMVGSKAYLDSVDKEEEDITAAVILDMVGYASSAPHSQYVPESISSAFPGLKEKVDANDGKGDFVICIANANSTTLRDKFVSGMETEIPGRKVISMLTPGNGEIVPSLRRSDHSSFWDKNYPAIFIGDGADSRNPNYHSARDRKETLDYAFMKDCAGGVLGFVLTESHARHGSMIWKTVHL